MLNKIKLYLHYAAELSAPTGERNMSGYRAHVWLGTKRLIRKGAYLACNRSQTASQLSELAGRFTQTNREGTHGIHFPTVTTPEELEEVLTQAGFAVETASLP